MGSIFFSSGVENKGGEKRTAARLKVSDDARSASPGSHSWGSPRSSPGVRFQKQVAHLGSDPKKSLKVSEEGR